jgi:putative ABC transport system permease protein
MTSPPDPFRRVRAFGAGLAHTPADAARDVREALRGWRARPGFVAMAVLSLACGIGLNTAVFSIVNAVFLQSIRGVPDPGRIVQLGPRGSFAAFEAVRDASLTLEQVAAWQPVATIVQIGDRQVRAAAPVVTADYFETLGVVPALGRFFRTDGAAADPEVVLDFEFWQRTLDGDPSVLGREVAVNRVTAVVVGVAPRAFHGFGPVRPPLWIPVGMLPAPGREGSGGGGPDANGWRVFGRLPAGIAPAQVNAELAVLASRMPEIFTAGPLAGGTGPEELTGPPSPEKRIEFLLVVVLPLVVVVLILWIGCSNVATLLLARADARRRELAIRLACGAGRPRLVRMLLTESLLLAGAGAALGFLVGNRALEAIWLTLPEAPRLAVELDGHVLAYTALVAVIATLFFGMAPAFHATRLDVLPLLKGESGTTTGRRSGARLRRFFLVTQFASSMAILIVAATFVRAVVQSYTGDTSRIVDHATLASFDLDALTAAQRPAQAAGIRAVVERLPGVTSYTLLPSDTSSRALLPEGGGQQDAVSVAVQAVDAGFVPTSGAIVVAGTADPERVDPGSALLNEVAARQGWGRVTIAGERFTLSGSEPLRVGGVVRDDGQGARVYLPRTDERVPVAMALIRTAAPADRMAGAIRAALATSAADTGFARAQTLRDASTGPLQRLTAFAAAIDVLVLILAATGLYAAVSFVSAQRRREIAVRVSIGAPPAAVLRLVAREAVLVVTGGALLGAMLTWVAFRFMSGMIFASWQLDPLTMAGVLGVLALATAAACAGPGLRALRIDPMRVLQSD